MIIIIDVIHSHLYGNCFVHLILFRLIFRPLTWPFLKTATNGAQTTLWAALSPTLDKKSGLYYRYNPILFE